ncbi:MAG: hypothetical protein R3F43_06455 [bacterium]
MSASLDVTSAVEVMAQAGYRVRIRQPDPEEIEGLATMIAPFVDLDVERLEEALREGPAIVGDGLDRREAEQLARLYTRLGAQTDLVAPDEPAPGRALEPPETREPAPAPPMRPVAPAEPDFIRETQPFDARALREALMDRGARLPSGEEALPPSRAPTSRSLAAPPSRSAPARSGRPWRPPSSRRARPRPPSPSPRPGRATRPSAW